LSTYHSFHVQLLDSHHIATIGRHFNVIIIIISLVWHCKQRICLLYNNTSQPDLCLLSIALRGIKPERKENSIVLLCCVKLDLHCEMIVCVDRQFCALFACLIEAFVKL
jgi:hypothetical protein